MKMKKILPILTAIALMTQGIIIPAQAADDTVYIHVAKSGSDSNNGLTAESALLTVEKATKQVNAYMSDMPGKNITVVFHEGVYNIENTVSLTSGNDNTLVTYQAYEDDKVVFNGAKCINGTDFEAVTDENMLNKIPDTAKGNVLSMDISGISEVFDEHTYGYYGNSDTDYYELLKNGEQQILARYPNINDNGIYEYIHVEKGNWGNEYTEENEEIANGYFTVSPEKAALWKQADDYQNVGLNGFIKWDWAYARTYITGIDAQSGKVSFYPVGEAGEKNRFYVADLLEELDSPGEWFIDRKEKILYYYPEGEITAEDKFEITYLKKTMLELVGGNNVTIKNIAFENMRNSAISVSNAKNITVDNCTFKNIGKEGIIAENCTDFTLQGSSFYNIGSRGIMLSGGNSDTLTKSNNKIINNEFDTVGQVSRSYHGAVSITGCGGLVANNTMINTPHQMIGYSGTYQRILYNDIKNACVDAGDMGAIYNGRKIIDRGNEIAYNYIHDTVSTSDYNLVAGIYMDDGLAGQHIHHNVIKNARKGIYMASGSDLSVHDNIILDCVSAITLAESNGNENSYEGIFNDAINYIADKPYYIETFPTLKYLDNTKTLAHGTFIYDNLVVNSGCELYDNTYKTLEFGQGGRKNRRENNHLLESFDGFVDSANENYAVNNDNAILNDLPNIASIDMSEIGKNASSDYSDRYTPVLTNEIENALNNMESYISYGDYSYFDVIDEYFAKAEVNNLNTAEFKENDVYQRCIAKRNEYDENCSIPVELSYNKNYIYSSAKGVMGSAGYSGAFYYNDFISDKYIEWDKPWTEGMKENILRNQGIYFKLKVIDHNYYKNTENCVLWNNDTKNDYTTIDIVDGYYNTAEILANSDKQTDVSKYLTVVLRYADGTNAAYRYSLNYFNNGKSDITVSSTRTKDGADESYELVDFGNISKYSVPVDNTKMLVAIDVLNDRLVIETDSEGEFVRDENGEYKLLQSSGTERYYYESTAAIYAVSITSNKELLEKSAADRELVKELNEKISKLPELEYLRWENREELIEIRQQLDLCENIDEILPLIENYEAFIQAEERILSLEPKLEIFDLSPYLNTAYVYSSLFNMNQGNAGYTGAFYYDDFISDKYINWEKPWTEGMTENILITEEIPFKLKVSPHASWASQYEVNTTFRNITQDTSPAFSNIDIPDNKYASIRILANSDTQEGSRTMGVKINYTDASFEVKEYSMQYVTNGLNSDGIGGILSTMSSTSAETVEDLKPNGGITHYKVLTDPTKVVESIDIINDRFEFEKDENGEYIYNEDGSIKTKLSDYTSRYMYSHATAIYAITLETNEYLSGEDYDFNISEVNAVSNDKTLGVKVTTQKTFHNSEGVLIAALYDNAGRMKEMKMISADEGEQEIQFDGEYEDYTEYEVKCFIWQDISSIKPEGTAKKAVY